MKRIILLYCLIFLYSCSSKTSDINSIEPAESIDGSAVVEETETIDKDEQLGYEGYFNIADNADFKYQMDDSKQYDQTRSYYGIVIEYTDGVYSAFYYEADEYLSGSGTFAKTDYENVEQGEDGLLYFETNTVVPKHINANGVLTNAYSFDIINETFILTNLSSDNKTTSEFYKTEKLPKYIVKQLSNQ